MRKAAALTRHHAAVLGAVTYAANNYSVTNVAPSGAVVTTVKRDSVGPATPARKGQRRQGARTAGAATSRAPQDFMTAEPSPQVTSGASARQRGTQRSPSTAAVAAAVARRVRVDADQRCLHQHLRDLRLRPRSASPCRRAVARRLGEAAAASVGGACEPSLTTVPHAQPLEEYIQEVPTAALFSGAGGFASCFGGGGGVAGGRGGGGGSPPSRADGGGVTASRACAAAPARAPLRFSSSAPAPRAAALRHASPEASTRDPPTGVGSSVDWAGRSPSVRSARSAVASVSGFAGTLPWGGCLLYTSPSPRDQRGSRMPSSA